MRFESKVAVVTGGGQGIGEGYAKALAKEGASVVIAELAEAQGERVAREISASGGEAVFVKTDVSSEDSTLAMGRAAVEAFMSVNMDGCVLATRAVHESMAERGGGAIVNQSSSAAWMGAGYYGIAKLAMHAITHSLARELGPKNIRVNAIAPGPTDTEATRKVVPDFIRDSILATMPLPRMGEVSDMVNACLFLLSDESSWITAQILAVDGGQIMRA
ncbi:MAG: SDR family oxidoreductase [Planctomycetota bacterium]|jgi:NAD(P)-dependent dehydrogenase (short-subunit alcohol dehydrogenase family)